MALKNVVFFHPDLGIGGAERLVVDAAVGLQNKGHKVTIFTSHCDPAHCFEEARDGTLDVRVRGNTLIPPSFGNRFSILCAILRQLHLVFQISLLSPELRNLNPQVFFLDQLSAAVPLLRLLHGGVPVLFYCHFPDKLLAYRQNFLKQLYRIPLFQEVLPVSKELVREVAVEEDWLLHGGVPVLFYCHFPDKLLAYRQNFLKQLYRIPFDMIESWSTGASSVIVVNSEFTRSIFGKAFPDLRLRKPKVVYPCVDIPRDAARPISEQRKELWEGKKVILSINRFERKKEVGLAVDAFAKVPHQVRKTARLVIAGGHDPRMAENVQYHQELVERAEKLGLKTATANTLVAALAVPADVDVLFLLSVPAALKTTLLEAATLLVYTPKFEHFGIVPIEAMLAGVPVLAAQTGGPRETVVNGTTGWLCDFDEPTAWTSVMRQALEPSKMEMLARMGEAGRQRVMAHFSQDTMAARISEIAQSIKTSDGPSVMEIWQIVEVSMLALCGLLLAGTALWLVTYHPWEAATSELQSRRL